jgi:hypothetical protein
MKLNIVSDISLGATLFNYSQQQLKNETMFFGADWFFALANAGQQTIEFMRNLDPSWKGEGTIIDSRVHMLMPGWYPCIPGYHHDDVPRERSDGQPEYHSPSYRSEHAMAIYNGDICPTEFALGHQEFDDVELGKVYYKEWHPQVTEHLKTGGLVPWNAQADRIIYFNDRTWHQGTKAVKAGWRLFIRASRNTNRPVMNEVRRQVQVYLENPMEGW